MAGRRWRLVVLVAAIVLLALAGAAAAATLIRWNGGLGYGYGNGVGIPVRLGQSFSIGMTDLRPARRVRIEAVRLHGPNGGIRLVGVVVLPPGSGGVGTDRQFPPRYPHVKMRPAVGTVVPAHARVEMIIGLQATNRGAFSVRGVDVFYREHWHGLDLRRRAHVGVEIQGCAEASSTGIPRCKVPPFSWDGAF